MGMSRLVTFEYVMSFGLLSGCNISILYFCLHPMNLEFLPFGQTGDVPALCVFPCNVNLLPMKLRDVPEAAFNMTNRRRQSNSLLGAGFRFNGGVAALVLRHKHLNPD